MTKHWVKASTSIKVIFFCGYSRQLTTKSRGRMSHRATVGGGEPCARCLHWVELLDLTRLPTEVIK